MNSPDSIYDSVVEQLNGLGLRRMAIKLDELYSSSDFLCLDRLTMLSQIVSSEYEAKASKALEGRLKKCHLWGSPESIESCRDSCERSYAPKGIAEQLSSLSFIKRGYNALILGASDSGKSYFAKAMAIQACASYRGEYHHSVPLIESLAELRRNDYEQYEKRMKRLSKLDFLVLDDFLISPVGCDAEAHILYAVLESRCENMKSTIICSQRDPKCWPDMLMNDKVTSDAIVKRASRNYTVLITKQAVN